MRPIILLFFSFFLVFSACDNSTEKQPVESEDVKIENLRNDSPNLLRHVVLFNFNETANDETIKQIEEAFADLPKQISEIHSFEWGTNNSPEGLDKGYTHCFLVTFLSEEDRDSYLPHPAHLEFVKLIESYIEDVTVIDYWAK